jgi:hypothetical protein
MTLLRAIGRSRIGELAQSGGAALLKMANPLALVVSVRLPELDPEEFADGPQRYQHLLDGAIKDYLLEQPAKGWPTASFIEITTDDGKSICLGLIKHLGTPIGHIGGIADEGNDSVFTFAEAVWLCATQLNMRVHSLLAPNGSSAIEILGRQVIRSLYGDGVRSLAIGSGGGPEAWLSLYRTGNRTRVKEIEGLPQEQVAAIADGETIGENTIGYLWIDHEIAAGLWVSTEPGFKLAVGFEDRKLVNSRVIAKIKEQVERSARSNYDYLIKSFEKLKADFKKLVKSERAAAITETAVTINHEINNPLTAILGNAQLLLMAKDKLPPDIVSKLETIERSAVRIRETTSKLMSIIEPVTSSYVSGLEMIDIEKSKKKKNQ